MAEQLSEQEIIAATLNAVQEEAEMLYKMRPWWQRGASCFIAFCLVNAVAMIWAAALRWVYYDFWYIFFIVGDLVAAFLGAAYLSARGATGK